MWYKIHTVGKSQLSGVALKLENMLEKKKKDQNLNKWR